MSDIVASPRDCETQSNQRPLDPDQCCGAEPSSHGVCPTYTVVPHSKGAAAQLLKFPGSSQASLASERSDPLRLVGVLV